MEKKLQYYIGDGRTHFIISRLVEKSNLSEVEKQMIMDELEKLSLVCQGLSEHLSILDSQYVRGRELIKHLEVNK
jgi:hypothetical protein